MNDTTAVELPDRCLECNFCEEIHGAIHYCSQMERPIILLPREVYRNHPSFCPFDPDYRPAVIIKKPR